MTPAELQTPVSQIEMANLIAVLDGLKHQDIARRMAFEIDRARAFKARVNNILYDNTTKAPE